MARKQTEARPRGMAALGSLERLEVVRVQRAQLHRAPYNPKVLSDAARAKLDGIIRKIGLVEPACVWNERSGLICGGHQRLTILDNYYGGQDYELTVSKINVGPKREREICVALSNLEAQGDIDMEKLEELIRVELPDEGKLELEAMGLNAGSVYKMFGDQAFDESRADELLELGHKLESERAKHAEIVKGNEGRDGFEFYVVFVFKSTDDTTEFLDKHGFSNDTFQDGAELDRLIETGSKGFAPVTEDDDG